TIACADATEPGRTAPLPSLRPSELLEPSKALLYVGNVQNGCHLFHVHRIIPFSCNRDHNSVAPKSKDVARLKHDASSPGRYSFSPTLDTLIQHIGYHVNYEGTNREPRQSRHQLPHRQPRASTPNESRNDPRRARREKRCQSLDDLVGGACGEQPYSSRVGEN